MIIGKVELGFRESFLLCLRTCNYQDSDSRQDRCTDRHSCCGEDNMAS